MSLPSIEALTIGYFLSAWTEALTKKDMKPRRTPCSFSKRSWYFFLKSITGCMLTSLNVVRIAAVDCDCTRRSAMRARKRLIGTRCSGRSARICSTLTGAGGWGKEGFAAAGGSGAGGLFAPRTSPLVTRPPRPLPAMAAVSIPFSSASFLAAGMTGTALAAGFTAGTGAGAAFSGAAAGAAALAALAFPSVSITAMTSPALTVPPSPLIIFASTPSAGAGSSRTTLSVSMSIRFSSRLTASPTFLCHASSVASATDSESCGTLISISMLLSSLLLRWLARRPAHALNRADQIVAHRSERRVDQLLLLLVVQGSIAHRGRGRGRPRGVGEDLVLAHVAQEVALNPVPRALIRRLLLAPEDLRRIPVKIDLLLKLVVREGVELGDAHNGGVLDRARLAPLAQIEKHLAAADDHALDVFRFDIPVPFAVDRLELALGEFGERRHRLLVAQQALGREDDERLAVRPD